MVSTVAEILAELIAQPSVNPRHADVGDATAGESRITDWLARFAVHAGWRWTRQSVHPGRDNFLALIPGVGDGLAAGPMLWEAHQDTVAVGGMTVAPFAATVRQGRMHGRGACDVKGSLAAMLTALRLLSASPTSPRPSILLAAAVNEECGFTGARALADMWRDGGEAGVDEAGGLTLAELRALRPVAAIVAEPTELDVVVAHRGVVRWRCVAHGRAAHSSQPEQGVNAIYAMTEVIRAVDQFHREELATRAADLRCGPSTAIVTTIHGGTGANTIPDRAIIDIDRRLAPDESPEAAYRELVDFVAAHCASTAGRIEHEPPWMQSRGLMADANAAWAERVSAVVRRCGARGRIVGVPYGTNAASIAAAGIPTVVIGPGSIEQAHTADEWIAIDQLDAAVEVFSQIAVEGLRLEA